jgi:metallo-beta-lactamase class B
LRPKASMAIAFLLLLSASLAAQEVRPEYIRPLAPTKVIGNLYYVGGYGLASYLITTNDGHILINTGIPGSVPAIRSSIEALGFKVEDIKILLATHAHWDHVGDMAEMKRLTHATLMMHVGDVPMLEDGGSIDYRFREPQKRKYEPVKVDRPLVDGDKVKLGGTELTVLHHPGHTMGSASFMFTTQDNGRAYRVLIVNMATTNEEVNFFDAPAYPNSIEDYARTFAKQKQLAPDVWVSSHAHHFGLHNKYKAGSPYDPMRFFDPQGYLAAVERNEKEYLEKVEQDRKEKSK